MGFPKNLFLDLVEIPSNVPELSTLYTTNIEPSYVKCESEVKTQVRTSVWGGWVAALVPDLKKFFLKI